MSIQKEFGACHSLGWPPHQWRVNPCASFLLSRPLGWVITTDYDLLRDLDFYYPALTGCIAVGTLLTFSVRAMPCAMVSSKTNILKKFPSFISQSPHQHILQRMAWQAVILSGCKLTQINLLLSPRFPSSYIWDLPRSRGFQAQTRMTVSEQTAVPQLWQPSLCELLGQLRVLQLPWARCGRCWAELTPRQSQQLSWRATIPSVTFNVSKA